MTLIYGIIGFIAVLIAFQQIQNEKFSPLLKSIILVLITILFALFYFLEQKNVQYQTKVNDIFIPFEQNKTLECNLIDSDELVEINQTKFNLTSNSFLGKKDSEFQGEIIPLANLKECKIK